MDCLDGLKLIPSESTSLIVADPPYFQGLTHDGKRASFSDLNISKPFFSALFNEFDRILLPGGEVYFFTDWRGYAFYYPMFDEVFKAKNLIVWDKVSGPGNHYSFSHELILFSFKGSQKHKKGRNVWQIKAFSSGAKKLEGEKVHPTQKPLELISKIVSQNTVEGDLVVDPFSGSGTTAHVCKLHDRRFVGFEIVEDYYLQSIKRVAAA